MQGKGTDTGRRPAEKLGRLGILVHNADTRKYKKIGETRPVPRAG